ncbi:MAG: hypothetical protein IJB16_09345 [Clostridia bacterium]|nr:hypothetical protein [Clostridia bacterium]
MKKYRFVCFILSLVMILGPLNITAFAAEDSWKPKNKEPFIFVHGLNGWGGAEGINGIAPYWGATTGDLMSYLQSEGYECYSASVGPLSSAWDRACELYAQLIGSTVDYGEAHSKEHNHDRYGRTYYQALVPDWGDLDNNGKIQQIHLIGHSFGGTTVRMLIQLLNEGSPEEIAATSSDDISGLFTGGKGNWIKSATTVCTPHNSSTVYYPLKALGLYEIVQNISFLYAGIMGRSFFNGRLVDFHLEQFGLTDVFNGEKADGLIEALIRVQENLDDTCIYDLTPEGTAKLNKECNINKDIYYFSYPFSTTSDVSFINIEIPDIKTNPVIYLTALIMGIMPEFTDPYTGIVYDESWHANDALVNTESAKHPVDEPHMDYDANNVEKGIWNVMPVQKGDHGAAIGLFSDEEQVKSFYLNLCEMLCELP